MILTAILTLTYAAAAEKVELTPSAADVQVTVVAADGDRTAIRCEINAFAKTPVDILGENYYEIYCGEEGTNLVAGEPQLPHVSRSLIIPDDAGMKITVLDAEYLDYPLTPVAPSKGNLPRTVNPADVPYAFGPIYDKNEWYPANTAQLREPFILRDFRGTVVDLYPFQYNPALQILRVYTRITVTIESDGPSDINIISRHEPYTRVVPDFELIYQRRFINYGQGALLYTPVPEAGDMLVITHDAFHADVLPLVEWKNQMGMKTALVNVSTIGNTSSQIGNFIQAFYDSTDLAFVLLVGDAAQVATPFSAGGAADPTYAKVSGDDDYPDIFIGRFSAENSAQVATQVQRTLDYEMNPQAGDWNHRATGIASAEGPGHYGEYDFQHMELIRGDLLGYNYDLVDQIYDPGATAAQVTQALNSGRGLVNYCGHGSATAWGTTGYSNSHVNGLANPGMLPVIISVACQNGRFNGMTCFAEAWLRASRNGQPTGAVATYMSSIDQSWNPPMYAQDEAADLLVAEAKTTFGGLCFNGSCRMIDVEGYDGINMFDTWHIFGDPSLRIYTTTPSAMTVIHEDVIMFSADHFDIEVSGIEGALCAIYGGGILYGTAFTESNGLAQIEFAELPPIGQDVALTVTAFNHLPYIVEIPVIAPEGAYVIFDSCAVNDSDGNDNGLIDFGEDILLGMQLQNIGPDSAYDVIAALSSADDYITITDSTEAFGNIAGDFGNAFRQDAYAFAVESDIPDGHVISFQLLISGFASETWTGNFTITAHAPEIEYAAVLIDDAGGNGNGILEAGETAVAIVTLRNDGSCLAGSVGGLLSENDNYVSVADANGAFGDLSAEGGSGDNSDDPFTLIAGDDFPSGYSVTFDLQVVADGGYLKELQFVLRSSESFENNDGGYAGSGEWEWGEPTYGPPGAYYGLNVWATNLDGEYGLDRNDFLVGVPDQIYSSDAYLEFYHWFDMEDRYDGGQVQVSTNGGSTWSLITPADGYPNSNVYALGGPGYTGAFTTWRPARFEMANFVGQEVLFRWRFASDYMINAAGWYIDDVVMMNNYQTEAPEMSYNPTSFDVSAVAGGSEQRVLTIANSGNGPLHFDLTAQTDEGRFARQGDLQSEPTSAAGWGPSADKATGRLEPYFPPMTSGFGGPDGYGYTWTDSDEPGGPTYNWIDITGDGSLIEGLGDDVNLGPFPIGFDFDFYGDIYSSFRVCSNGFISFTSTSDNYANFGLPTSGEEPLNMIAPLWDDLDIEDGGEVYYYSSGDSLIVSYINLPHHDGGGPTGPYTFQVILLAQSGLANGDIVFQYQDINSPAQSATVGIQNADGSIGLQVVFNAAYLHDELALLIDRPINWLTADPPSGTVEPDQSLEATITFDAAELEEGTYTGSLLLESNDPTNPSVTIPVTFEVLPSSFCEYVPGDINGDGQVSGSDITYGAAYFRGGAVPPDSCFDDSLQAWLYVAGDVNGNCEFLGSDISYLVSYFRGIHQALLWCPRLAPPQTAVVRGGDVIKREDAAVR